ncbi:MAG TPA: hypothetical protein VEL82_06360 [Thermoplasmata archaeon]|nr:hypothetical protein [Thermoplasmata archaeon]
MVEPTAGRTKRTADRPPDLSLPEDLGRRLAPWIDVREVGAEGLWMWLGTVLALLPAPGDPTHPGSDRDADRWRSLARDLVDCARERARLTVMAERYFNDNRLLTLRVKALEASLRTAARAGAAIAPPSDEEADEAAARYLPARRGR